MGIDFKNILKNMEKKAEKTFNEYNFICLSDTCVNDSDIPSPSVKENVIIHSSALNSLPVYGPVSLWFLSYFEIPARKSLCHFLQLDGDAFSGAGPPARLRLRRARSGSLLPVRLRKGARPPFPVDLPRRTSREPPQISSNAFVRAEFGGTRKAAGRKVRSEDPPQAVATFVLSKLEDRYKLKKKTKQIN